MTVVFALLGLALAATLALGLSAWRQRRHQPVSFFDYAVAGGGARWGTVLASVLAAETSAATLLGVPAEGLALGTYHHLQILAGMVLGRVVVAVTFLPHLHRRGVVSIYGLLGSRFGPRTQRLGAATFLVTRLLATGTRVYVGAIVLAVAVELAQGGQLAPVPKLGLYVLAALVLCGFTALYTSLGGMRAVLWTDTLQTGIMLTAVGGCLSFLLQTVGWAPLMAAPLLDWGWGENGGTLATWRHIRLSPYTVWSGLIGTLFTTLATHGVDQDAMQRLLAAPDLRRARRALVLSGLCEIPILTALASIGILLRVHLGGAGAGLRPGNEIFAHFILTALPPGLCALMLTAVMTTTMGSLSAALNALATSYTQDWRRPCADDQAAVAVARRATWGMAAILVTIAVPPPPSSCCSRSCGSSPW